MGLCHTHPRRGLGVEGGEAWTGKRAGGPCPLTIVVFVWCWRGVRGVPTRSEDVGSSTSDSSHHPSSGGNTFAASITHSVSSVMPRHQQIARVAHLELSLADSQASGLTVMESERDPLVNSDGWNMFDPKLEENRRVGAFEDLSSRPAVERTPQQKAFLSRWGFGGGQGGQGDQGGAGGAEPSMPAPLLAPTVQPPMALLPLRQGSPGHGGGGGFGFGSGAGGGGGGGGGVGFGAGGPRAVVGVGGVSPVSPGRASASKSARAGLVSYGSSDGSLFVSGSASVAGTVPEGAISGDSGDGMVRTSSDSGFGVGAAGGDGTAPQGGDVTPPDSPPVGARAGLSAAVGAVAPRGSGNGHAAAAGEPHPVVNESKMGDGGDDPGVARGDDAGFAGAPLPHGRAPAAPESKLDDGAATVEVVGDSPLVSDLSSSPGGSRSHSGGVRRVDLFYDGTAGDVQGFPEHVAAFAQAQVQAYARRATSGSEGKERDGDDARDYTLRTSSDGSSRDAGSASTSAQRASAGAPVEPGEHHAGSSLSSATGGDDRAQRVTPRRTASYSVRSLLFRSRNRRGASEATGLRVDASHEDWDHTGDEHMGSASSTPSSPCGSTVSSPGGSSARLLGGRWHRGGGGTGAPSAGTSSHASSFRSHVTAPVVNVSPLFELDSGGSESGSPGAVAAGMGGSRGRLDRSGSSVAIGSAGVGGGGLGGGYVVGSAPFPPSSPSSLSPTSATRRGGGRLLNVFNRLTGWASRRGTVDVGGEGVAAPEGSGAMVVGGAPPTPVASGPVDLRCDTSLAGRYAGGSSAGSGAPASSGGGPLTAWQSPRHRRGLLAASPTASSGSDWEHSPRVLLPSLPLSAMAASSSASGHLASFSGSLDASVDSSGEVLDRRHRPSSGHSGGPMADGCGLRASRSNSGGTSGAGGGTVPGGAPPLRPGSGGVGGPLGPLGPPGQGSLDTGAGVAFVTSPPGGRGGPPESPLSRSGVLRRKGGVSCVCLGTRRGGGGRR
jgi:hypothetical protein